MRLRNMMTMATPIAIAVPAYHPAASTPAVDKPSHASNGVASDTPTQQPTQAKTALPSVPAARILFVHFISFSLQIHVTRRLQKRYKLK
jgi:hypothetical protein